MREEAVGFEIEAGGDGSSAGDVEFLFRECEVALRGEVLESSDGVLDSDGGGSGDFGRFSGGQVDCAEEGAFERPDTGGEANEVSIEDGTAADGPDGDESVISEDFSARRCCLELPDRLAGLGIDGVDASVVGAEHDLAIGDEWSEPDRSIGEDFPLELSGPCVVGGDAVGAC